MTRARILLPVIAVVSALGLFVEGTAWAHSVTFGTRITLSAPHQVPAGKDFKVHGDVKSAQPACRRRLVKLFVFEGPDYGMEGFAYSHADGSYSIRVHPLTRGTHSMYTKAEPKTLTSKHPHRHRCRGDRSPTRKVEAS